MRFQTLPPMENSNDNRNDQGRPGPCPRAGGRHHRRHAGAARIPLALGGLLSISWGVKLAHALPERVLRGLFCGFLVLCALLLALE